MERPSDWNPKILPFAKTLFLRELIKEGEQFTAAGGRAGLIEAVSTGMNSVTNTGIGKKRKFNDSLILKYSKLYESANSGGGSKGGFGGVGEGVGVGVGTRKLKGKKNSKKSKAIETTAAYYSKIFIQLTEPLEVIKTTSLTTSFSTSAAVEVAVVTPTEESLAMKVLNETKYPVEDGWYWGMVMKSGGVRLPPPLPTLPSLPSLHIPSHSPTFFILFVRS